MVENKIVNEQEVANFIYVDEETMLILLSMMLIINTW